MMSCSVYKDSQEVYTVVEFSETNIFDIIFPCFEKYYQLHTCICLDAFK